LDSSQNLANDNCNYGTTFARNEFWVFVMVDVASEARRRLDLWNTISNERLNDLEPARLRDLGIYGGAQGIWVDKAHTASPELGPDGVTVAILHTGRHYADDLSDDGVIYHYPTTHRPAARDAAEVQATKNAMVHRIPIFIVLPGTESKSRRSLKLGWVCDFDDENRQFLILFGGEHPPAYSKAETTTEPFQLEQSPNRKASTVMVRVGQQRFRFHVMSRYGHKCAVCEIRHPSLLKAAHIRGKAEYGTDDWRNGLPLCATHHDAFDRYLFGIDPETGAVRCKPGINEKDIGLREKKLTTLKNTPHVDALRWRWSETKKEWKGETD
jgi:putative restriction endonuclease